VNGVDDLGLALQDRLDSDPDDSLVLLLDEADRYISENPSRHLLIEALRSLSQKYRERFRVVVAGFMDLYDCLKGRGPYSPTSDPWQRMFDDIGPLGNLRAESAESIVQRGFREILGWRFENQAIPQYIVERTGGHPAFVQGFCLKLRQCVAARGDRIIRLKDVEAVFADQDPDGSFMAYVGKTLGQNLDAIGRFVILYLADTSNKTDTFTRDQVNQIAGLCRWPIPDGLLSRSLEQLCVTSVVKERSKGVYEFTVSDYPRILSRLGKTGQWDQCEEEVRLEIEKHEGKSHVR
jgi:hypothetical protein